MDSGSRLRLAGVTLVLKSRRDQHRPYCQSLPIFAITLSEVSMATMNVSLPDPMRDWVDDQGKSGEYANASDYIRDLIRHDQERRQALQAAIREGLESGRSPRRAEDVMATAKARLPKVSTLTGILPKDASAEEYRRYLRRKHL